MYPSPCEKAVFRDQGWWGSDLLSLMGAWSLAMRRQPKIPRLERSVGNPETGPWHVDENSLSAGQKPQCVVSAHVPPSILKLGDLHGPGQRSSQSVDLVQVRHLFKYCVAVVNLPFTQQCKNSESRGVFEPRITKTRE